VRNFPNTPEYTGLNLPIGEEYDCPELEITGQIPPGVSGTHFRATPDPAYPPFREDGGAILSGDGMVSALRIGGAKASFSIRYVQTERHKAEVAAGQAIFGIYRNVFTDLPLAAGLDRTVANTTPVWHAGKLLMTKEDGRAYRVDPRTLQTLGSYDFGGKLTSQTMTAHVRIDPVTGEMFFFGYEAQGTATNIISYCVADREGNLISEHHFEAPYCAMMHDFAITEHYALFPIYPTTCDLDRLKAGGDHWIHEPDRDSWLGVMPRYGNPSQLRWFRGPKSGYCYHIMNAFEDVDGIIHMDQCMSDVNPFPFIQRASGISLQPGKNGGRLERWTANFTGANDAVLQTPIGPPGDFPVIPNAKQGRPYDHAWMLTMNPDAQGPPVAGGPVGAMFNVLLRLDFTGKPLRALVLPPSHCFNEPVHIPSRDPGHEGYLLMQVDEQLGPNEFEHSVWILDAGNIEQGSIARIRIPRRLRPQVHGWWVTDAQLAVAP
jgi:carotenoid cleavage dioxygenase-like enzyme